jgi:hypothetical protein
MLVQLYQAGHAAYFCQICTFSDPKRCGRQSQNYSCWQQGEELWVELGPNVQAVAEHTADHGPLGSGQLEDVTWRDKGGHDESPVYNGQGVGTEAVHLKVYAWLY